MVSFNIEYSILVTSISNTIYLLIYYCTIGTYTTKLFNVCKTNRPAVYIISVFFQQPTPDTTVCHQDMIVLHTILSIVKDRILLFHRCRFKYSTVSHPACVCFHLFWSNWYYSIGPRDWHKKWKINTDKCTRAHTRHCR